MLVPPALNTVACGYVEFIPYDVTQYRGGIAYEKIAAIVSFSDGHRERAVFPYPWTYRDPETHDPWSASNLRNMRFVVTVQRPPAGFSDPLPPLISFVLNHTDERGYTTLPACPASPAPASPTSARPSALP